MGVRIERIDPRHGEAETPLQTARGFELVDGRAYGMRANGLKGRADHATFIRSIEDAAYLVEQGYSIKMTGEGKRAALVTPAKLRIVRD